MNQAVFPDMTQAYTRCIHCMGEISSRSAPCPHCAHPEQNFYPHPLYLSPHTLLRGQYLLGTVLGQGGFGITYIGLDLKLNKRVAIKEYLPSSLALRELQTAQVIPLHHQADALQKGLHSFIQEARNLAKFNHPNIVRVLNYFEENQTAYMVMEYLEGDNPARRLCDQGGKLSIDAALRIVLPILDALEAIHVQAVFHLDVSAHNVLLTHNDAPVLIDFGAARSVSVIAEYTRSMTLVLKPGYSPLEQYSDQGNIGAWTDIYACAALLYLLLHGQLPPAATERWQQDTLQTALPNQDDSRAPSIERALKKALAVNPQQRWQQVAAFRAALLAPQRQPLVRPVLAYAFIGSLLVFALWLAAEQNTATESPAMTTPTRSVSAAATNLTFKPADIVQAAQDYWLDYAEQHAQAEQFDTAYQSYQAILQLQAEHPQALQGLQQLAELRLAQARSHYQQGDYRAGLAVTQQSQAYFPARRDFQVLQQAFALALETQQRQAQITQLLATAEAQLQARKLTTPTDDNAYASYLALLEIAADDPRVQQLPQRIAERYTQLARSSADAEKRRAFIDKGLSISPTHATLLALQEEQRQAAANTLSEATSTAPQVATAFAQAEVPQVVEIDAAAQQAAQDEIAQWLQSAQLALAEDQLEVAYEAYRKVLSLHAQDANARQGLRDIAARYTSLAMQAKDRGELVESLVLVGRGLGVQAQYPPLLQLQEALREALNKPAAVQNNAADKAQSKPLLLTPSF